MKFTMYKMCNELNTAKQMLFYDTKQETGRERDTAYVKD